MKIRFLSKFITCIATMIFIGNGYAQQSENAFKEERSFTSQESNAANFDKNSFPDSRRSEISIKAVRDFTKRYEYAENVRWYQIAKGIVVYFTEDSVENKSFYSNNGNWLYNVRSYSASCLPTDVRAQVKSVYYDFSITLVNEITNVQQTTYLVHMEDKNGWKNVKVSGGEMDVVEDLKKQ